jgi:hypothetical protein
MTTLAVAAWGTLIKCLKTLVNLPTDSADDTPAYQAVEKQYDVVVALRPMARAAWKRLILENKVNRRLC